MDLLWNIAKPTLMIHKRSKAPKELMIMFLDSCNNRFFINADCMSQSERHGCCVATEDASRSAAFRSAQSHVKTHTTSKTTPTRSSSGVRLRLLSVAIIAKILRNKWHWN
jgi:hypothetical protein